MSAFEVRKLNPNRRANDFIPCQAGNCHAKIGTANIGHRSAAFEVLIIGYPTLLCSKCTKTWRACWLGALDGAEEEAA